MFEKFPAEWADPTYKLSRTILFLFVLMVSFPYLPGSNSAFFQRLLGVYRCSGDFRIAVVSLETCWPESC